MYNIIPQYSSGWLETPPPFLYFATFLRSQMKRRSKEVNLNFMNLKTTYSDITDTRENSKTEI